MRNVILTVFSAFLLLNTVSASAQIITRNGKDTAVGYYGGGITFVHNDIKSGSSAPVYLKWNVQDSYFGPGWEIVGSGFCDNNQCYSAGGATNNLFTNGTMYKSVEYNPNTFGDFHMQFEASNPAIGSSAWVRVNARDTVGNSSRSLTFIVYRAPNGINNTVNSSDDIVLFPNPARDAVNVLYDSKSGIKTIAVYNLIGKLMGPVYKPADNGSAKIELTDMPNGIYFIRLMNGSGHVVATRRFTRQ